MSERDSLALNPHLRNPGRYGYLGFGRYYDQTKRKSVDIKEIWRDDSETRPTGWPRWGGADVGMG